MGRGGVRAMQPAVELAAEGPVDRWAEGHYDRLPPLAADLVGRKVDLIMASSPPSALAAKTATSAIPIVFRSGADPVGDGLVNSIAEFCPST